MSTNGVKKLQGITWDHSRGYDPMVATSLTFSANKGSVEFDWQKRSLQAFADRPIEELAIQFDLMVIDHPHVGEVAKSGLLLPLDGQGFDAELQTLASQSLGPSHDSYNFAGRQWALAIDAASPVAAFRPDQLIEAPTQWNEVVQLAKDSRVAFALIPINALMTFFGMAKNTGAAIAEGEQFVSPDVGEQILERMKEIASLMDPRCLELDPIGIYDWMSGDEDAPIYSPFGYGYSNYSRQGYCRFSLAFCDAPGIESSNPAGTVLGGTGIAISANTAHPDLALQYAFWIASADCQRELFFNSGGQPANSKAWESDHCNNKSLNFFRSTRQTLDQSWLRPRYAGYMALQATAGDLIHDYLRGTIKTGPTLEALQRAYSDSLS